MEPTLNLLPEPCAFFVSFSKSFCFFSCKTKIFKHQASIRKHTLKTHGIPLFTPVVRSYLIYCCLFIGYIYLIPLASLPDPYLKYYNVVMFSFNIIYYKCDAFLLEGTQSCNLEQGWSESVM